MNKLQKATTIIGITTAALTATHFINKFIFSSSVSGNNTDIDDLCTFHWKLGDIAYIKKGTGKPLLLVHDLNSMSSCQEWEKVIMALSKDHTVYALDLLGCGHSDKPGIIYTAYLYVQLISDFITKIIGKRTDVIATGDSAPMIIMSCKNNSSLFDKIILVNPQDLDECKKSPSKQYTLLRKFLNAPIVGVSIYNMFMSKQNILDECMDELFYKCDENALSYAQILYENAHLGGFTSRHLFASTQCHYTCTTIERALAEIDNSIFIITGENKNDVSFITSKYEKLNPAIEVLPVSRAKKLPQWERPARFMKQLSIIL